jgi:hypothetical protein
LEHYKASIGEDEAFVKEAENLIDEVAPNPLSSIYLLGGYEAALEEYTRKLHRAARNRTLALAFLKGADRKLYGTLWIELENQYTRQHDQYPHDLTAAYNMHIKNCEMELVLGIHEVSTPKFFSLTSQR